VGDAQFKTLLDALPEIAESVEKFQSEAVQRQVVEGLFQALLTVEAPLNEDPTPPTPKTDRGTDRGEEVEADETPTQPENATRRNGRSGSKSKSTTKAQPAKRNAPPPAAIRTDINFRPDGATTLKNFVGEKKPKNLYAKIAVIVFWLVEHSTEKTVDAGAVAAGIREIGERQPSDLSNTLSVTSGSKYGYINARNRNDITLTVHGDNLVRHDLPADS
jgi:hypothetical protein